MNHIRFGVVCEGPSDFAIIEWSLRAGLAEAGHTAEFQAIHPVRDKTSGTFEDGGWRQVYRWCLRNSVADRRRFFGQGLFDDDEAIAIDLLVVHLDGDIQVILSQGDSWKRVTTLDPSGYENSPSGAHRFAYELIQDWLYQGATDRDGSLPLPTVLESEAWLLAGLNWHSDPESISEPKTEFAREWLQRNGKPVQQGLRKLTNHVGVVWETVKATQADVSSLQSGSSSFVRALSDIAAKVSA